MIAEYARFAIEGLREKGIRSLLTMVGIFIGIAAVVSLISLGQGLQDAINEQFASLGSDIILISPGGSIFDFGAGAKLTEDDLDTVEATRGVDLAAPMAMKIAKIEAGDEVSYTYIAGIPVDERLELVKQMGSVDLAEGRWLKSNDRYKAMVGYRFPQADVFDDAVGIRDRIAIEGRQFEVVATMESVGNSQDDQNVYIPIDVAFDLFAIDNYMTIMARGKSGADVEEIADDITEELRESRDVEEGEEDFSVETSASLLETIGSVIDTVTYIVYIIAALAIIVGGVGIMNTMYTSVMERTREIGVMKAIGATNADILTIFLVEAGILGMIGGVIGIVIGLAMSLSVEYAVALSGNPGLLTAHVSPELVVGALAFSFGVGCVSGVLPARQAAGLKPVDALRYE